METSAEYLDTVNDNILVMVQIETKEGVENVREIAQVDGVGKYEICSPLEASLIKQHKPPFTILRCFVYWTLRSLHFFGIS